MRYADVCEFWSPEGGGVKTYVEARWRAAHAAGHHVDVIAPSARDRITPMPGGALVEVRAPRHPIDPRYHIFWGTRPVHAALARCNPDLIEASSPWRGAWLVASYDSAVPRTLFMHEEPVQKYPYRWLDGHFSRGTIDRRLVPWFWRHLRRLYGRYDALICAAPSTAARLEQAGITNSVTIPMGVDAGTFSPAHRDEDLRATYLARMGLPATAPLVIAIGRLVAEKRWPVIIEGFQRAAARTPMGLIALGGGHAGARIARTIGGDPRILQLPPIAGRADYARTLASADLFLHASNAETFGLAAAEALASGLPLISPDEGAVADLTDPAHSETYRTGNPEDAAQALKTLIARLPLARTAAARAASRARTLDDHFRDLFADYERRIDGAAALTRA